jgi:membrane-bound lytic murein transglycosylase B
MQGTSHRRRAIKYHRRAGQRPFVCVLWTILGCALLLGTSPVQAQQQDFDAWLRTLRQEARQRGISDRTLQAALSGLRPIPRVIELDRRQIEFRLTFAQYLRRVVPPQRVQYGRQLFAKHRKLLTEIGAKYGVQPRFIVTLWGIESDFGRRTGGFSVLGALATLAYDGRRSAFFRRELLDALHIVDEGHITPEAMFGSWAGAMGQSQFMPSSFRRFAVDYNGDGRRDIWNTTNDVLASIANYLARAGWRDDQTWGRRVTIPAKFATRLTGLETRKPIPAWQKLGVRRLDGSNLPRRPLPASLLIPDGPQGPAYLVYDNYRTILKWNRSTYFGLAVGYFSDQLRRE